MGDMQSSQGGNGPSDDTVPTLGLSSTDAQTTHPQTTAGTLDSTAVPQNDNDMVGKGPQPLTLLDDTPDVTEIVEHHDYVPVGRVPVRPRLDPYAGIAKGKGKGRKDDDDDDDPPPHPGPPPLPEHRLWMKCCVCKTQCGWGDVCGLHGVTIDLDMPPGKGGINTRYHCEPEGVHFTCWRCCYLGQTAPLQNDGYDYLFANTRVCPCCVHDAQRLLRPPRTRVAFTPSRPITYGRNQPRDGQFIPMYPYSMRNEMDFGTKTPME